MKSHLPVNFLRLFTFMFLPIQITGRALASRFNVARDVIVSLHLVLLNTGKAP